MKRYNVSGAPVLFNEDLNGYWVKYEDYNLLNLDCNKKIERLWEAEITVQERVKQEFIEKLEKQQHIIIILSVVAFALAAIGLFRILM
jgi:hypothetical protein